MVSFVDSIVKVNGMPATDSKVHSVLVNSVNAQVKTTISKKRPPELLNSAKYKIEPKNLIKGKMKQVNLQKMAEKFATELLTTRKACDIYFDCYCVYGDKFTNLVRKYLEEKIPNIKELAIKALKSGEIHI